MENTKIYEMLDQERWLINNGLITDTVKNQLFFCGSIVHKDVKAVEVKIKPEEKLVEYVIYVDNSLINKIKNYHELSKEKSLWKMWRFKRLLKREGCLDFNQVLTAFIKDYCGPKWTAVADVVDFSMYTDKIEEVENGTETQIDA